MVDISKFIEAKSDQLNAADLSGRELTITITEVRYDLGKAEQPLEVFYEGCNGKPWRPSKAAGRILTHFWGTETDNYLGRSIRLFNDTTVTFGKELTGGIRINAMSGIKAKQTVRVPVARMRYKDYTIDVIQDAPAKPKAQEPQALTEDEVFEHLAIARDVATLGKDRLNQHWATLSPAVKKALKPFTAELRTITEQAARQSDEETLV